MKISYSKKELYDTCGLKYKFKYIDKLQGNYISSALLYGSAMDSALNFILEAMRDGNAFHHDQPKKIFLDKMKEWDGSVRLDYFNGDLPNRDEDLDPNDPQSQQLVWQTLHDRGLASIDVYIKEVLPLIDKVISVQNAGSIKDNDDEFVYIVDFVAKLKDGRTVLFDNKTSSAKYPRNKVLKSEQLSLYLESFPEIKYCGYIVLIKNPEKVAKQEAFQIIVDEIPEETRQMAFDKLENALHNIKAEIFEPNLKSCGLYGKQCEYANLCKFNDPTGLVPVPERKP